jgi:hypothetical protein
VALFLKSVRQRGRNSATLVLSAGEILALVMGTSEKGCSGDAPNGLVAVILMRGEETTMRCLGEEKGQAVVASLLMDSWVHIDEYLGTVSIHLGTDVLQHKSQYETTLSPVDLRS